jgi:hypothetical protein
MLHTSMETPQCTKVGTLTQKYITFIMPEIYEKQEQKVYQDATEIRKNLSKRTAVTESVLNTIYEC